MAKPKAIGEAEATELEQIHAQCTKLEEELEMWKLKVKALTLSNRVSEIQEEWGAGTSSGESNKEVSIVLQANQENLAVRVLKKFIVGRPTMKMMRIGHYMIFRDPMYSGSYGRIFGAFNNQTQTYVAMKLKRKTQSDRLECQIMLRVRHPNIIELYDRYFNYNSEFIMMELAEFDLRQLREHHTLGLNDMIKIVLDIAEGLAYIHSHLIVHGDIKSLNMLVINGVVKICDFGEASYLPVPAGRRGSALYSAPELIRRDWASEYFTLKCDVWSFGILIIELLERKIPYQSTFGNDYNKFCKYVKSSKYVAPRLSTRGPKWHQINFGKILAHALAFRTDIRCNAAQLLVMIKKLDMDNKKQSVYEEKLKSANDRREKLLIEIEKQKELVNAHRAGTMNIEDAIATLLQKSAPSATPPSRLVKYKVELVSSDFAPAANNIINLDSPSNFPLVSVHRRSDGKRFALKMMRADKCATMEAEMMRSLNHFNIIHLEEAFVEDNKHFLVLERCENNMNAFKKTSLYGASSMLNFTSSILHGLMFLERKRICHLNLRAEHLLYSQSGGQLEFKICNFGEAERLPFLGGKRGTAHWMAPEIIRGYWAGEVYGHKNDLWSFGIALMEILQGHAPDHDLSDYEYYMKVRDPAFTAPMLMAPPGSWERIYFGQFLAGALILDPNCRIDTLRQHIGLMSLYDHNDGKTLLEVAAKM